MVRVRSPAVAGTFYPDDPAALHAAVRGYLRSSRGKEGDAPAKALIVPHAGYVYSGPIAASGYAQIASRREEIRRVVLLGPAHRVAVEGLAAPAADRFATQTEVDFAQGSQHNVTGQRASAPAAPKIAGHVDDR